MTSRVAVVLLFISALVAGGLYWNLRSTRAPVALDKETQPSVVLSDEKQKSIWDAEHIAFELESRFGKPFLAALASRDAATMRAFFREDSVTDLGQETRQETRQVGVVGEITHQFEDSGQASDADALVQGLLVAVADFEKLDRKKLRVLNVARTPDVPGQWETRLLMTVSGSDQDGTMLLRESEHLVTFQLATETKIPVDRIISRWRIRASTARRATQRLMEEVTESSGLDRLNLPDNWLLPAASVNTYNFQMAVEDFNRDGYPDIAIASGNRRPMLLRSDRGQRFGDVSSAMGLHAWSGSSALVGWIDFDNDGFPDLLMGNRLYANQQGERFEEVPGNAGLAINTDPMGCVVADYDCDGWLDIYVLYQHAAERPETTPWVGDNESGARNQLWRNNGQGGFEDVTPRADASGGRRLTFAASWLFLDDDHFPDLYVANDFGGNVLLQNTGQGSFQDVTREAGVGDFATSMGVAAGDMNNDGSPEIYVANMFSKMGRRIIAQIGEDDYPAGIYEQIRGSCAGNRLYSRQGDRPVFEELSEQIGVNRVGWAYAPAFADLNNDGWQDLYATTGYLSFSRRKPDG